MKCMKRQLLKGVVFSGVLFMGIWLNSTKVAAAEISESSTEAVEIAEMQVSEPETSEVAEVQEEQEEQEEQEILVEEEPKVSEAVQSEPLEEIEVAQESQLEVGDTEILLEAAEENEEENEEVQSGLDVNNAIKEMEDELAAINSDVDALVDISWESGELYEKNELTYEAAQRYLAEAKDILDDALEKYDSILKKYEYINEKPADLVEAEKRLAAAQKSYDKAYAEYKRVWEDEGGEFTYANYIFYSDANKGYYPFEYSYEEYLEQIEELQRQREDYLDQPDKLQEIDQKIEELWEIAWSAEEYSKHPAGIYDDLVAELKAAYENDVKPYVDKKDKAEAKLEWAKKYYKKVYNSHNYEEFERAQYDAYYIVDEAEQMKKEAQNIYYSMRDGMDYIFGVDFNPNFELNTTFQGKQVHLKVNLATKLRREICKLDICSMNICELICDCERIQKLVCDYILEAIGDVEITVSDENGILWSDKRDLDYSVKYFYHG